MFAVNPGSMHHLLSSVGNPQSALQTKEDPGTRQSGHEHLICKYSNKSISCHDANQTNVLLSSVMFTWWNKKGVKGRDRDRRRKEIRLEKER